MNQLLGWVSVIFLAMLLAGGIKAAPKTYSGTPLISCYTIVLGLFGIYFLLPSFLLVLLQQSRYVWIPRVGGEASLALTAAVCSLAVIIFVVGYLATARRYRQGATASVPQQSTYLSVSLAWGLVILGVLMKLYVIFTSGGLEITVTRLSSGVSQSLDIEQVSAPLVSLRFLSGIADAAITWLLIERMHLKRRILPILCIFLFVVGLSFVGTGKRLYILWPILTAVLATHYYVRPLKISVLPFAAAAFVGLGFLTLMFRIYAPASLGNVNMNLDAIPWAQGSLLRFYFFSLEFATFETLSLSIFDRHLVLAQFGDGVSAFFRTNIEPLSYFVPRLIWPSKPELLVDISHANRALILGGSLSEGGGIASTLLGTTWVIAGPIGFSVAMLALGYCSALLDRNPEIVGIPTPRRLVIYAFAIVGVFHVFRQGTLGWVAIILIVQQIGAIIGFAAIFYVDRRRRVVPIKVKRTRSAPRATRR